MTEAVTAKQNNGTDYGGLYFIRYPRGFGLPSLGLTGSAKLIGGLLEKFPNFSRTHKDITEILGIPSATVTRGLKRLKDKCSLTKTGMSSYKFEENELVQSVKGKWNCPIAIIKEKFKIYDDAGEVVSERRLPYSAQDVYALIYTKLSRKYSKKDEYLEFNYDELAAELDYDPGTISRAIDLLKHAKLIYFPKSHKGKNRYKKTSAVKLKKNWSWFKDEKVYRAKQTAPKKPPKSAGMSREEYYGKLARAAQKNADKAQRRAKKNKQYNKVTEEIKSVRELYINALGDSQQAKELADKIEILNAEREKILNNIGLSVEQLSVDYYYKCKCCNDTGYRIADGMLCDCFEHRTRQRGSPPDDGNRTTKGTE